MSVLPGPSHNDTAQAAQYTYARTVTKYLALGITFTSQSSRAVLFISTVSAVPRADNNEFYLDGTSSRQITLLAVDSYCSFLRSVLFVC